MNAVVKPANAMPAFGGWEELGAKAASWKIEREEVLAEVAAPFFPDQNGRVYEQLLANFPAMMHAMDGSGRVNSVNQQWCKALGYLPSDVIGRSFNELLTGQSRSHLITHIYPRYLQSGFCRNEEIFMHRKDGTLATLLLSMNAYRSDKGRVERSICIMHDITERKIAEIAASRSDQRYRGAFLASSLGMALVSPTGQIESCNQAFASFLGRREPDVAAMAFDELMHREDRGLFLNGMRRLMTGEISALKQDLRFATATGGLAHGAVSVSSVRNEKSEVELLIAQVADITERRIGMQRMQQSQKMEAIGQLTGGLAHDFNNLLTIILGNLQLIEARTSGDEAIQRRMREAIDAAQKGSDLTRQLLTFARRQELEPKEVEVNAIIQGMEALIARSLGDEVEMKVICEDTSPHVVIDPSQLESAILNLAINARDAMPKGGKLTVETQSTQLDADYAARHPEVTPGPYVMVAVSDTGTGMTPDVVEKVFQPFFTTKEQGRGTGLGLSMVYGFIKQSGGHVSIYSEVGHGTTVKMYLPQRGVHAVPAASPVFGHARPMSQQDEKPPMPGRLRKILVVEDQEAVRAVACGFLSDFGYDVVEAEDGFQALAKLQEDPDIDLMFSDIVMPGGMNGFDLAQAASGMRPDIKIVHTSGYPKGAMVHQDEPRFRQGFIIMKPYRREELQKIIADAFEKQ
jgi:PAS domain S-box-containing protein